MFGSFQCRPSGLVPSWMRPGASFGVAWTPLEAGVAVAGVGDPSFWEIWETAGKKKKCETLWNCWMKHININIKPKFKHQRLCVLWWSFPYQQKKPTSLPSGLVRSDHCQGDPVFNCLVNNNSDKTWAQQFVGVVDAERVGAWTMIFFILPLCWNIDSSCFTSNHQGTGILISGICRHQ